MQEKTLSNVDIVNELKEERRKNGKLTSDLKKSVTLIKEINNINTGKDLQIEKLTKQLQQISLNSKSTGNDENLFNEFSGLFSKEQLQKLRSISTGVHKDSTFVLNCMKFMFPNANDLNNITVSGRKSKGIKKQKMSDKDIKIIKSMLSKRIVSENADDASFSQRIGNVNRLMKNAICKLKNPSTKSTSKPWSETQVENYQNPTNFPENEQFANEPNYGWTGLLTPNNLIQTTNQCICEQCLQNSMSSSNFSQSNNFYNM